MKRAYAACLGQCPQQHPTKRFISTRCGHSLRCKSQQMRLPRRSATAAGSSMLFFDEDNHNLVEAACRHEEGQEVAADTVPEAEGEGSEEESDMVVQ